MNEDLNNTNNIVNSDSNINNNVVVPENIDNNINSNTTEQPNINNESNIETLDNNESLENNRPIITQEEIKRIEDQGIELNTKFTKKLTKIIIIGLILLAIYFIILNPIIKFKSYEKEMLKAAERYYEINSDKLPTGNRVGTVSLQTLFTEKYIKKDFYVPFTKDPCSVTKSWVKTRTVNNETKNYVYLYCGKLFQSKVDHTGPVIKLNGEEKMTINKGEEFKDPGVASVKDASDGELSVDDVIVKSKINSKSVGKQTITYTAFDYLNNKTEVTREVIIVERIGNAVKSQVKDGYIKGNSPNNYILFGRNLFRVVGLDSNNNAIIVSDDEIGNVNYDGLDEYLEEYYNLLPEESKKLIVESTYCNQTMNEKSTTTTDCSSKTEKRKVYIPSIDLVNNTMDNGETYLHDFYWLANTKDKSNAFAVTDLLGYTDSIYMARPNNEYFGVRPLITIKGDLLIKSGDGSVNNPYELTKDKAKAKAGEKIYDRVPGEYIIIDGSTWRILKTEEDSPTKIISTERLVTADGTDVRENNSEDSSTKFTYNPKKKGNIGYKINNQASRYLNTKYLVKHEIEVPIYKNNVLYKKETSTKKYTVKYSAPDVFGLYVVGENLPYGKGEYYHLNSSNNGYHIVVLSETGIPEFLEATRYVRYGIKVVSYLNKDVEVVSGKGTLNKPYVVSD